MYVSGMKTHAPGCFVALICIVLAACQPPAQTPSPSYNLIDLTGAYEDFYDRTTDMAEAERVAAFKTEMNAAFPGFYDSARFSRPDPERYDARIARSFEQFPEIRAAYDQTRASFVSTVDPALAHFVETFPDFEDIGDIYLVHSLGEMDGGGREINGKPYFVFGADMIAILHPPGSERPFLQHELFHLYHQQFFEGCDQVWCILWREGMATYVSRALNPDASDDDLLLEFPEPIPPAVDANLPLAVCDVTARLDSDDFDDLAPLFMGGGEKLDGLPLRFAYYVGELTVAEAVKTHDLQALAHADNVEARTVLDAALANLAACPPAAD